MNLSPGKKYTILVVDDDDDILWLMQQRLIIEGFVPLLSPNAVNIMGIIADRHPDLVLLDIHMNGVEGGDICKKIKSVPAMTSIPVILFSSNDNIELVSKQCGADGFMAKPFDTVSFHSIIDRFVKKAS